MNLTELNRAVLAGTSGGKIIWQPRILCWYYDRLWNGGQLEVPYTGMSLSELYRSLGCSNRVYEYNACFREKVEGVVNRISQKINDLETECIIETPAGAVSNITRRNTSNYGEYFMKPWVTCEKDLKVFTWLCEHTAWEWDQQPYHSVKAEWSDLGVPSTFCLRTNIQMLLVVLSGVQEGVYMLNDYPEAVERYFVALEESQQRLVDVICGSPVEMINFGDNIHAGVLSPRLFVKYTLPAYQRLGSRLRAAGKFTTAHWDGDVKPLLPYMRDTGLSGIEAVTPRPQGDVDLVDVRKAMGDDMFLIDGLAAILFDPLYPLEELLSQARECIELFAPRLVLGISDEMPSRGDIERIRAVGKLVDEYNSTS